MCRVPFIIGISGGSGSGKSRFARRIKSAFPEESTVIEQDWYYRDLSGINIEQAKNTNFDHPSSVEHTLLHHHLNCLNQGIEVEAPDYSYINYRRLLSDNVLVPSPLIILEGLFVLRWPEIRNLLDFKLYINVDSKTRLERRLKRDTKDRGYTADQIRASWSQQTIPMHHEHVEPSLKHADFIWNSEEDTAFESRFLADLERRLTKDAKNPK